MGYNPEWAFGFGLSYTTFEVSDLTVDKTSISRKDEIKVTVNVKNTGTVTVKK